MGVVYLAHHQQLKRSVALKMVLAGDFATAEQRLRFLIEAEMAARVRHPNIVQVYEVGTHEGRPFYALEYVAGGTLAARLRQSRRSPREAAVLLETLAKAVQAAHSQGILHRDLKPANILLDADGTPKITDFGLAKRLDDDGGLTATGQAMGTPQYMAPEQVQGRKDIGPPADLHALGAILYELLTGRPPFFGATAQEVMRQVEAIVPAPPSRVAPYAPRDLDVICLKCLEKEPAHRYASAADLAAELRRFLEGRPIAARPVGHAEQAWRWCRRNPLVASLSATIVVALVGGIIGTTWGMLRAGDALAQEAQLRGFAQIKEQDAKRETAAARSAEADTAAFSKFLVEHVLATARPENAYGGLGIEVTVAKALTVAEQHIDEVFRDRPLAEAETRAAIGSTWNHLGKYPEAERHLRRAVELWRQELGADHAKTLEAQFDLAVDLDQAGRFADAIAIFESVRQARTRTLGEGHPDTLKTVNGLASTYRSVGRSAEAVTLLEAARELQLKAQGPEHMNTLALLNTLAGAYGDVGQRPQQIDLLQRVWEAQSRTMGAEHPDTLVSLNNLALAYDNSGQLPRAIEIYRQVCDGDRKKLGADHPFTNIAVNNLAMAYARNSQPELALAQHRLAAEGVEKRKFQQQYAARIMANVIGFLEGQGLWAEAATWRRKWADAVKARDGGESPAYAVELGQLAGNLFRQSKWSDAESVLREYLAAREKTQPNDWLTFNGKAMLGVSLLRQMRYAEAEKHLLEGYEGAANDAARHPAEYAVGSVKRQRFSETIEWLAKLYDAWGKPEEAARRRKELEALTTGEKK